MLQRKGKKKPSRRISPEPQAMAGGGGGGGYAGGAPAAESNLKETVKVQAQAIREMTTSLERASLLMEKQSDTFTTDMAALQDVKTKLEARVRELEAKVAGESNSAAGATSSSSSASEPTAPSDSPSALVCPDPVEAAEMMIELDDIIMTVKRKGAAKSLPSIVKHIITLFRYFFPAQLVEIVVLDPYSDGVFWSMECRTGGDSQVVFFDDSGEDLGAQSKLMADVVAKCAIASIKDGVHEAEFGRIGTVNTSKADTNVPILEAPSEGAVEAWAKNQNARSGTTASSGLMIPIRDNRSIASSQSAAAAPAAAGVTAQSPVLAVLHIVNRMDSRGNVVNFAESDLSLLKLLVTRCSEIFKQTRTLTGLLSASRRRFGSFDGVLGKSVTLDVMGGESDSGGESKSLDAQMRQSSIEQQLSQTKSWLKEKLAHREYKMIFSKRNPAIQKKLDSFVVVLKALCKFLKTLARLRDKHREATMITRKKSLLTDLNARQVMTFDFDEFAATGEELESHAYNILDMHGMIKSVHTPPDRLKLFIKRVRDAYLDNPYHCWKHGFMVMRTASILVGSCPHVKLSPAEMCAFAISGMCHDIAHPGKNNNFEQKVQSELAIRYNDKSIYENMHAATTFEILADPAADVFATLTVEKRAALRKMMIQCILMTDMASHFDLAKQLETRVNADGGVTASFNATEKPEDKQLILDLLLHSADIGGQAMPLEIANKWSYAVLEEFQLVHEAEKEAGIDLTPFIIGLDQPLRAANCQLGFINFIVKPLWSNLLNLLPAHNSALMSNLQDNISFWKGEVETHATKKVDGDAESKEDPPKDVAEPNDVAEQKDDITTKDPEKRDSAPDDTDVQAAEA